MNLTFAQIQALPVSAELRIMWADDTKKLVVIPPGVAGAGIVWAANGAATQAEGDEESAPYDVGNVTGDITLARTFGAVQKLALTGGTASRVLNPPSGGTEGQTLLAVITNSTEASCDLDLDAAIIIPSDSLLNLPKTIADTKTYLVKLYCDGSAWWLMSFSGAY